MSKKARGAVLVAAVLWPSAAQAHVTVQPQRAIAGSFTVESVRVPNERRNARVTKVDVKLPHGFASLSYEAVPGWRVKLSKVKLDKPVKTDDGVVIEEFGRITWSATSGRAGIQPGEFRDFPLSVQIPDKAGRRLTFKAVQTYSDGQVVRWIGAPDSDEPAPQLTVDAAGSERSGAVAEAAGNASGGSQGGASRGLAIAALLLGILGALVGTVSLVRKGGRNR